VDLELLKSLLSERHYRRQRVFRVAIETALSFPKATSSPFIESIVEDRTSDDLLFPISLVASRTTTNVEIP
jgi:hypothetical protein